VLAFAKAAERVGQAAPAKVDEYLRRGSAAFLRKDYAAALRILGALLPPIGEGDIDLGQHENGGRGAGRRRRGVRRAVRRVRVHARSARGARKSVRTTIGEVHGVGHFWQPLRELERVIVEPLPHLDRFLPEWRALIASNPAGRTSDWDTEQDRWLPGKAALENRAVAALAACPERAARQRALLHLLGHDFAAAAKLLASAPGLGWSDGEHPGHLLFPVFARLLGAPKRTTRQDIDPTVHRGMDLEELEAIADPVKPRLITPEVEGLLEVVGVDRISGAASRATVFAVMKNAAERRTAGVTERKRRQHYGHAAELVATCVACDKTGETARWAAAPQATYRRFPALRDELARALRAS